MSAETFRKLTALGLNNDQIAGVLELMEANERQWKEADEARKAVTRERVQRWRDNQKSDVTLQKRNGNVTKRLVTRVEDSSSKEEISGEERKQDFVSPKAQPKNGSRIPDDFEPDLLFAGRLGLDKGEAAHEAAQFLDYWRAKAGAGARKQDWPKTWQVWVRNAISRRKPQRSSTGPPPSKKMTVGEYAINNIRTGNFSDLPIGTAASAATRRDESRNGLGHGESVRFLELVAKKAERGGSG